MTDTSCQVGYRCGSVPGVTTPPAPIPDYIERYLSTLAPRHQALARLLYAWKTDNGDDGTWDGVPLRLSHWLTTKAGEAIEGDLTDLLEYRVPLITSRWDLYDLKVKRANARRVRTLEAKIPKSLIELLP
jgi:hypothetical protein